MLNLWGCIPLLHTVREGCFCMDTFFSFCLFLLWKLSKNVALIGLHPFFVWCQWMLPQAMNPYEQHGGCNGNNWKQGKCKGLIPYAWGKGGAAGRNCGFFSRSGEWFMLPPWDFCGGKGAWLCPHPPINSAIMSGSLNMVNYERYTQ